MTRTRATALAGLVTVLALPALAQEGFPTWDGNGDGSIDQDEFNESFAGLELFEQWDTDGDGFMSERELGFGLFEGYDTDESGRIERPEYDRLLKDFSHDGLLEI